MKKLALTICLLMVAALVATLAAGTALAADKKLEVTVGQMVEGTTSTGEPYIRVIVAESRTLDGEAYTVGVPLMFFNSNGMYEAGKQLQPGQAITVIAQPRVYESRPSYTALKLIQ